MMFVITCLKIMLRNISLLECGRRGMHMILVGKPEGKRPLGRPRHRWVNNIKVDLRDIGWDGLIWIRIGTSEGLL
jgi:hypothetical protein